MGNTNTIRTIRSYSSKLLSSACTACRKNNDFNLDVDGSWLLVVLRRWLYWTNDDAAMFSRNIHHPHQCPSVSRHVRSLLPRMKLATALASLKRKQPSQLHYQTLGCHQRVSGVVKWLVSSTVDNLAYIIAAITL